MDILVCPVCKGKLTLSVEKEDERGVVTGTLHCATCNIDYPINESIPNLMPPEKD